MHVFLGITGASGAPYADRLLRRLVDAECEVGICASRSSLFAAPGFYDGWETVDDLIEFVVERALDHVGLDREGARRWGQ